MSAELISRSSDLRRLRDEGYDIAVVDGHLLVRHVPYVNAEKQVQRGMLVSTLHLAGDVTAKPDTHVVHFAGEYPCNQDGLAIEGIRHKSVARSLGSGIQVDHSFSNKPAAGYSDYHHKMTTYATILSGPAEAIDPSATAKTFPVISAPEDQSVFCYEDTASSRAGIAAISHKLKLGSVAIVGLGGSGSYVLDLVAKTPVEEIHLYDDDPFLQHNAFRSPGAPRIEDLRARLPKVEYFRTTYAHMRRKIHAHAERITEANIDLLQKMDFVFLCVDGGPDRGIIADRLAAWKVPFADVGIGLSVVDDSLLGILRITSGTAAKWDHVADGKRIPRVDGSRQEDVYSQNIQVADLNALCASLAVIKWKKAFGFYQDREREHHTTYTIDGNMLLSEECA